jgi:hypothetical protein
MRARAPFRLVKPGDIPRTFWMGGSPPRPRLVEDAFAPHPGRATARVHYQSLRSNWLLNGRTLYQRDGEVIAECRENLLDTLLSKRFDLLWKTFIRVIRGWF